MRCMPFTVQVVQLIFHLTNAQQSRSRVMIQYLRKYLGNRSGATAIEYGLIAAGIAGAIIVAVGLLGDNLSLLFDKVAKELAAG